MTDESTQFEETDVESETADGADVDASERSRVVCSVILDRLRKQDVVWVRIADPEARRVDDLLIAGRSRIDAYLIRWSEWAETLSLAHLVEEADGKRCLVKRLANGWKKLKRQYNLPVVVHLLTNDQASAKKFDGATKSDCHLAKFLAIEWRKNDQRDEKWADTWAQIKAASGLSDKLFSEFVEHCRFDCSYNRPVLDEDADEQQPYHWVEHIYDTLFEHEEHSRLPIELNHAELLQILGWRAEGDGQLVVPQRKRFDAGGQRAFSGGQSFGVVEEVLADRVLANEVFAEGVSADGGFSEDALADGVSEDGVFAEGVLSESVHSDGVLADGVVAEHVGADEVSADGAVAGETSRSLSSLRGAASAKWLEAAGDSGSEVADWLTASGAPVSQRPLGPSTSLTGDSADGDKAYEKRVSTSFVGRKVEKERRSWRDLADGARQQSAGLRRFAEPAEARSVDAESQRSTGKLRRMLSARIVEPTADGADDGTGEDATGDDADAGADELPDADGNPVADTGAEELSSTGANTISEAVSTPVDTGAENRSTVVAEPEDAFSKISRLAREQEGLGSANTTNNRDAFEWYFNNGNELFEASRFEDAALEYNRALELLNDLEGPNHEEEFAILQNLGDIYMFLDQPELAVELYERTKQHHFTAKIPAAKYIAALIKLGTMHEENNCFSDAEQEYRKAIEIAAEFLPKDDPILVRLNDACLNLARNRSTLMSRFSATEVDRIREMAKQETDVALMYRKKKTTEVDTEQIDIWRGGKKPDDDEPKAPPSPKKLWAAASVAIVIVFIFAYAILVPHSGTGGALPAGTGEPLGTYSSTDNLKVIELDKGGKAKYEYKGKHKNASYSFVGDTIQDLLPLIPGHLRTSYTFFRSADDAIVDADGTHYYIDHAPELQLVKRMWKYAELAQEFRAQKSFYPEADDAWAIAKEKLVFTNPITRKPDQAIIFSTTGDATDTPVRETIFKGEAWSGQPQSSPGRILCNVYNGRMFFIRGWDRNNKLLTTSDKKKCFYIEVSDGVDVTKEKLRDLHNGKLLSAGGSADAKDDEQPDNKRLKFIFAPSTDVETNFHLLLRAVPGVLFSIALFSVAFWRYRVNKKIAGPFSLAFCIVSVTLLLAWYVVGSLDVV